MKRIIALVLTFLMILCVCFTVSAEGESGARLSRFCSAASYRDYSNWFTEAEEAGVGSELTRAQMCAVAARLADAPETVSDDVAADVPADAWYAFGAKWAIDNGFYSIVETGLFTPEAPVSREELATFLRRVADFNSVSFGKVNDFYNFYDGYSFASSYGQDSANVLQKAGIMIEEEDGRFYPLKNVTVGEFESVFLHYAAAFTKKEGTFPGLPVSTVPASDPVDDSWFDDACFIGHSQVVGMQKYFNLPETDFYAVVGHTAKAVVDYDQYELPQGGFGTLRQGLENNAYGKIYIMLGINDCSDRETRDADFMDPMKQILDLVKETQPEASIYMISLAPVGMYTPNDYLYNPTNTIYYSQMVKTLSRMYGTEYLDIFRMMADSNGYMLNQYNAGDSIHINADQYGNILDYLKTHT